MIYIGKSGKNYNLENAPFSQGGEGKIFNIIGNADMVAKIYREGKNDSEKEKKLTVMVDNPPSKSIMRQIAWPLDILYDSNRNFAGFIMPKLAKSEDLNVIYEYGEDAKYANLSWRYKINIAKNLCAVLDAVHAAGHVVGDLNPKNISVNPSNGIVTFFDADSFHISDKTGKVYRCEVGMQEYLSAEIQLKMKEGLSAAPLPTFTKESDNFALAIHIFQLLMNGCHPFACRVLPSQDSVAFPQPSDNIIGGVFPFMQSKTGIAIPIYAPPVSILPDDIRELFKRAFILGHKSPDCRPTPEEWYYALEKLEKKLTVCSKVKTHEYYSKLNSCPWCETEHNTNSITQMQFESKIHQTPIKAPNVFAPPTTNSYTPVNSSANFRGKKKLGVIRKILYTIISTVAMFVGWIIGIIVGDGSSNGGWGLVLFFGGGFAIVIFLGFTWRKIWQSKYRRALLPILMSSIFVSAFVWGFLTTFLF